MSKEIIASPEVAAVAGCQDMELARVTRSDALRAFPEFA
jgi:hypothetical protein